MASKKIGKAAEFAEALDQACGTLHANLLEPVLYEESLKRGESGLVAGGPLLADTGVHTGRSPKDKFIVRDDKTDPTVWWEGNQEMSVAHFDALLEDFIAHAADREIFVQDLFGGAHPDHQIGVRVYTELAWHSLFIRNLLIRPQDGQAVGQPDMTIIDLPSFKADPTRHGARSETIIACDFTRGIVLIGGSSYAGEMKKSVFTYLNYILPEAGVMPMHCSANVGDDGKAAVFFGLSGTGKTTLSADASRTLVGDDEHGWGPDGVFNFEGGCYAKTINLSREAEPEIFSTTERFGTVLENVVVNAERIPDFADDSKTENTRAAYPLHFIDNASETGTAGHPSNVIMLACDAFGVMPPIARLNPAQALYHFLSGYTAKVAGTEKGVTEPEATFSTCFGHPFIPRPPVQYGELLRKYIHEQNADCWLINTGWTGGVYGVGRRMPIKVTRTLLGAVLDGRLRNAQFYTDRHFGFEVPTDVPGVEPHLLHPRKTWEDKAAFDAYAEKLVSMFVQNFAQFEPFVGADIKEAAPSPVAA